MDVVSWHSNDVSFEEHLVSLVGSVACVLGAAWPPSVRLQDILTAYKGSEPTAATTVSMAPACLLSVGHFVLATAPALVWLSIWRQTEMGALPWQCCIAGGNLLSAGIGLIYARNAQEILPVEQQFANLRGAAATSRPAITGAVWAYLVGFGTTIRLVGHVTAFLRDHTKRRLCPSVVCSALASYSAVLILMSIRLWIVQTPHWYFLFRFFILAACLLQLFASLVRCVACMQQLHVPRAAGPSVIYTPIN